ncbi:MAG TPA: ERCC4 domain-containing protein [Opitutaceae bacterium]
MEICVDSRESRSDVPRWLARLGYAITTAELAVGDYAIADKLLVERKAANDLALSIMDGRLFGQAELLASADAKMACVVIEGSLGELYSSIDPEAVAGALSTLTLYYGLPVIPTPSPEHTARLIGRLARHVTEGLGYEIALRAAKPKTDGGRAQYLVEGLPGVGAETARKLILHFGSAAAVFAAGEAELCAVRGIGAKTARGILDALHARPTAFRSTKGAALGE